MNKWDLRFAQLAGVVATWSKDPEVKVGAVIVAPTRRQFSQGYNGLPMGIFDDPELSKEERVQLSVHAEMNAILQCAFNVADSTLYVTKVPCLTCAKMIVQSQISRVVCTKLDPTSSWFKEQCRAVSLLTEAGVTVEYLTEGAYHG